MIPSANLEWNQGKEMIGVTDKPGSTDCHFGCTKAPSDYFHSVEFSVNGLNILYQTKIWNNVGKSGNKSYDYGKIYTDNQ